MLNTTTINCKGFLDQKPGTSGLRKKVKVFQQENYIQTYIQAVFNAVKIKGKAIVIGGDGRYYNKEALQIIIKIAIANNVESILVAKGGFLSTPAASNLIRKYKLDYGVILSASHNIGGIDGDFGIKINTSNGAPANINITNLIEKESQTISFYNDIVADNFSININKLGEQKILNTSIQVIDGIEDYTNLMMEIFDFESIKKYLKDNNFKFLFNSFYGITSPYAKDIFINKLGVPESFLVNVESREDFGGLTPDPNPISAKDFVKKVRNKKDNYIGFACDADGDRNFIFSKKYFLEPSDSLAILLQYIDILPYYKNNMAGVARSKATSPAIDLVAKKKGITSYIVPTGWKYFSNLLDSGKIGLCGEESFGLGSMHIREKDGLWAILFYLHIFAHTKLSLDDLIENLWQEYGRVYCARLDFEKLDNNLVEQFYTNLEASISTNKNSIINNYKLINSYNFSYIDSFDGIKVENQGLVIDFSNEATIIIRKSGTATDFSTIRAYLHQVDKSNNFSFEKTQYLKDLIDVLYQLINIKGLRPTLIV